MARFGISMRMKEGKISSAMISLFVIKKKKTFSGERKIARLRQMRRMGAQIMKRGKTFSNIHYKILNFSIRSCY